MNKIIATIGFICCLVVLVGLPAGLLIYDLTGPNYEFNTKVHGYMENAYYANTPELMIYNLEKSKQGMKDLGLTNDMYDAYFMWDKVPHKQMFYQYQHIDSIISRTNAVIQWRNENYGNESSGVPSESLGDVYEQKMDNLRGFLQEEGWSDWIANGAFYANYYVWLYTASIWGTIIWLLTCLLAAILFLKLIE